jgi:transposase
MRLERDARQSKLHSCRCPKLEPLLESAAAATGLAFTSMSQNNCSIIYAGLDIAKASLALYLKGSFHSLTNDPAGHQDLLKRLHPFPGVCVICEATGGYEKAVVAALQAAQVKVAVIEAGRVRHFARAQGRRAKSDPIDASVLAQYGQALCPPPTEPLPPSQVRLGLLSTRRQQLVQMTVEERGRAEHYADPFSQRQSRQLLRLLEKQILQCEQAIAQLIAADAELNHKAQRLDQIPGVGPVVASTVLAEMPELGKLSDGAAAALAGLAPYDRDSGQQQGIRSIGGGRKTVRCILYMAALTAIKHDPILKAFYLRLRAAGKKPKLALTAAMRKLIVLMNRLLKNPKFQLAN